jgi:succinate-acetate transporter protein
MATEDQEPSTAGRDVSFWRSHTQISLQPISAPSILGLFGFAAATFMVGANLAGWFGTDASPLVLFPFAMVAGGLAQFLAGMWSFRARDGVATGMHGMWGSFWIAYGVYYLLVAVRVLPAPLVSPIVQVTLGQWFIVMAAITWVGALAALAQNVALAAALAVLAAGSTLLAIAWTAAISVLVPIAGIVMAASAVIAFYTASAMMLQGSYGHTVLPMGRRRVVGAVPAQPIQYELGDPGVRVGQ